VQEEGGIAGVTVKLLNSAGAGGHHHDRRQRQLPVRQPDPGDYSAQVVAPTGYFLSAKDQGGNDATDSDFDPTTGKTIVTTLATGEADLSGMRACTRRLPSATRCGLTATTTASRMPAKPALPA
jgi:hypothetical protein